MAAKRAQSTAPQKSGHRLSGKVAVITGGSRGIGYAIAEAFQAEGCNVVITSRDQERLSAALSRLSVGRMPDGGQIRGQVCQVRDAGSVAALFEMVQALFGHVDVLVNNAGISQAPTPVEETPVEMWREMIDVNLNGIFLCTRAALPLMSAGGTIINNLSAAARQVFPNFAAYTAAKAGAYGFTRALRDELMPRGIRVTALMPGATSTDIWQQIMPDAPREGMMDVDSIAQSVVYAALLPAEANLSELLITPTAGAVGARNTGE